MATQEEWDEAERADHARAPRVTLEQVRLAIASDTYTVLPSGKVMVCELTLYNGFTVRGECAVVDAANFRADIGREMSRKRAEDKVWEVLGFQLQDRLHHQDGTTRVRPVETDTKALVAGAIYQFAADLTTREIPITLGAAHNAQPAADAVRDWLRANDIDDSVEPLMRWKPAAAAPADFRDRVRAEKSKLDDDLGKLEKFIDSELFQALPDPERSRMRRQASAMRDYSTVLHERIGAFGKATS